MKLSKNGVGLIVAIVALIGLDVPEQAIQGAWDGIASIVSLALLIWNQVDRENISWLIFKK